MKAKKENIVNHNRVYLGEVLPLEVPFSVFIDVCNACNFKCKFCAIQNENNFTFVKKAMNWELYKKAIDDIAKMGKPLKMLRLTANGEPLMNRELPKMIAYAKEKKVSSHIEIVTNGSLLTNELSLKIIDSGLDRIRISVEAIDEDGYEKICGKRIDYKKYVDNISYFYKNRKNCEVYVKIVDASLKSKDDEELFYKTFGDISTNISVEHVIPIWTDYKKIYEDFNITKNEGLHGHKIKEVNVCPFPFYSCVINPDGEVTVCCNDWKRGIVVGNINDQSFAEIWNGKRYRDFLMGMLENGRLCNHKTCATCEYPKYDAVDSIEECRMKILERYKNLIDN